jgi:acetylornithine deacetylase/succinyl-diaminopimelate desuccinylase-like protein
MFEMGAMDYEKARATIRDSWSRRILDSLSGLVEIPALSRAWDPAWKENGHLRAATEHVRGWIDSCNLPGVRCEVVQLDGLTPLLVVDVPASVNAVATGTVLLYGHLDKQPALGNWSEGLGPWQPVVREGRLYGRGAVDDGYSGYAAVTALEAVRAAGGEHGRAVILLETGEESGSPDLPAYLDHLAESLGGVSLVVCLDGGGGDYERLWLTKSLRGGVNLTITVKVLETSTHSGLAGGIVPSSFRIMRQLLDRVENSASGEITVPELNVAIPAQQRSDAEALAKLEPNTARVFPLVEGMRPVSDDDVELILNNTWRPTLSVVGAAGLPDPTSAGAVLRASTSLALSFRTPPSADAQAAAEALVKILTTDVPYGAQVEITNVMTLNGWHAPETAPWLSATLDRVGEQVFGRAPCSIGIGGGIPFMQMLSRRYPHAQFVVTGALGVDSNMHVPDEWLNIEFAQQVTEAVAYIIDAHARS